MQRGDQHSALQIKQSEVIERFLSSENKCEEVIEFTNGYQLGDHLVKQAEQYIFEYERNKSEVHAQFSNKTNKDATQEIINKSKVKSKAFELSKHKGNLRDYPSFEEDLEKLDKCTYGPDHYALKMCLMARHYKL